MQTGPTLTAVPGAQPARGLRVDAWRWTLGVCAVLIVAYPFLPDLVELGLYHVIGLVAVGGILAGVRLHRLPRPLPWLLLAAGQLAFVLGDGLWDLYDRVLGASPSPPPADILYVSGYPLLAAGLALLARRRSRAGATDLIDATIVTIGAAVVSWVFLISPYASDASLHAAERAVAMAYPVGDLLLLAMSVKLFLAPGGRSRAHTTLGLGLLAVLLADVVYAALTLASSSAISEHVVETGWLAGYVLIAVAVLDPTVRALSEPLRPAGEERRPRRLWLLACASLLAPATTVVQVVTGGDQHALLIAFTSAALFGLVVLRMAGLVARVHEQAVALARVARTDALTGARNRRAWDEQLAVEVERASRDGAPLSVALLDLDHFKAFNDRFGHPAGDRLLREAAAAWQAAMRTVDVLARYGGEEFGVILPGCRPEAAVAIVDRLRALTPHGETTSAGVAGWDGTESAAALVARADRALYAAKRAGRDRTVPATGAGPTVCAA